MLSIVMDAMKDRGVADDMPWSVAESQLDLVAGDSRIVSGGNGEPESVTRLEHVRRR